MQYTLSRIEAMFDNFVTKRCEVKPYIELWDRLLFRHELQFRINIQFSNFPEARQPQKPYIDWWQNALETRERRLKAKAERQKRWQRDASKHKQFLSAQANNNQFAVIQALLSNVQKKTMLVFQDVELTKQGKNGVITYAERRLVEVPIAPTPSRQVQKFNCNLVSNTRLSEAERAKLLEPMSVLPPRPTQNTPCVKEKGSATTEPITLGRRNRKLFADIAHEPSRQRTVAIDAEFKRQKRGKAFFEAWMRENSHLFAQAA